MMKLAFFAFLVLAYIKAMQGAIVLGNDVIDRPRSGSTSWLVIGQALKTSPVNGTVISLRVYTEHGSSFHVLAWRLGEAPLTYKLVGKYYQQNSKIGYQEIKLDCKDKFPIEEGDVFGVLGDIVWSESVSTEYGEAPQKNSGVPEIGVSLSFGIPSSAGKPYRTYSLEVIIEPRTYSLEVIIEPRKVVRDQHQDRFIKNIDRAATIEAFERVNAALPNICAMICSGIKTCTAFKLTNDGNCDLYHLVDLAEITTYAGKDLYVSHWVPCLIVNPLEEE